MHTKENFIKNMEELYFEFLKDVAKNFSVSDLCIITHDQGGTTFPRYRYSISPDRINVSCEDINIESESLNNNEKVIDSNVFFNQVDNLNIDNDEETKTEKLECSICFINEKKIVFNCGHMYCISCTKYLLIKDNILQEIHCPTCRGKITSINKLYF